MVPQKQAVLDMLLDLLLDMLLDLLLELLQLAAGLAAATAETPAATSARFFATAELEPEGLDRVHCPRHLVLHLPEVRNVAALLLGRQEVEQAQSPKDQQAQCSKDHHSAATPGSHSQQEVEQAAKEH